MDTSKLILRLDESARTKAVVVKESVSDKVDKSEFNEEATSSVSYTCPECGATFTDSLDIVACSCPECGELIEPEAGDYTEEFNSGLSEEELAIVQDALDMEDDPEMSEAALVIRGKKITGKAATLIKKLRSMKASGKKVTIDRKTGRIRMMTGAEKMRAKKFGRRMAKYSKMGKAKRLRTLKKTLRLKGESLDFDKATMMEIFNNVISESYKSIKDKYYVPTITEISDVYCGDCGLVIECKFEYDDGVVGMSNFIAEGFDGEAGEFNLVESGDIFVNESTELSLALDVSEEGCLVPMSFDYKVGISESAEADIAGKIVVEE